MEKEVVVAGAGFTGLSTALKLSRKGFDVKLLDKEGFHVFKPGLVPFLGGQLAEGKIKIELSSFLKDTGVEFSREKILHIDPDEEVVETNSGAHQYDYLVLALGSEPYTGRLDKEYLESVYSFSKVKKIKDGLSDAENITVVGAGLQGVEVSSELHQKGKKVTLIESGTRPLPEYSMDVSEKVLEYFNTEDIRFRGGLRVENLSEGLLELTDGTSIDTDMVIWAGGTQAPEVVRNSFNTGREGLEVNPGLCSKHYGNVFGTGDCVDHRSPMTVKQARKQAEVVAENISKTDSEALDHYEDSEGFSYVSLGSKGLVERGESIYISPVLKYLEFWRRITHKSRLKADRVKLKLM